MAENQWNDEFREPERSSRPDQSGDQWAGEAPPKPGMSGGMKAFLIIVAILGTGCVLCCGVVGFFAYQAFPKISQNPAEINAARDEICKIDLPKGFEPEHMMKMDNFFMTMTAVDYRDPAIDGNISFAQVKVKIGEPAQRDQAMRQQLDRQGIGTPRNLRNVKTETKSIEINGHESSFTFKRGEDTNSKKKICQVQGAFEGKRGPVWIFLQMDDKAFKEDAIVKMLEGIK